MQLKFVSRFRYLGNIVRNDELDDDDDDDDIARELETSLLVLIF